MKEKETGVLALSFSLAFIGIIFVFLSFDLTAYSLYKSISEATAPVVRMKKIEYYQKAIDSISTAIALNGLNADYLAQKADLLSQVIADNLKTVFNTDKTEIENLYKQAINLNPVDFKYHLKLGWFYAQQQDKKAEEEIKKSITLYPSYYQPYLYLAKYYLKNRNEKEAFNSILLCLYYGRNIWSYHIINEIKDELKSAKDFSVDDRKREWRFNIYPTGEIFDFRNYGFTHIIIPLNIKVYLKVSPAEVLLYKNNSLYGHFKKFGTAESNIYEFKIDNNANGIYFDELKIKTYPSQQIERIELISKF
jgi:hypothetical protein